VVKIRNIVYDKKPLQQAILEETTIWATHEGKDSNVGASELFQQDHRVTDWWCEDRQGDKVLILFSTLSESYDYIISTILYRKNSHLEGGHDNPIIKQDQEKAKSRWARRLRFGGHEIKGREEKKSPSSSKAYPFVTMKVIGIRTASIDNNSWRRKGKLRR